jgi:hypothetical protein
MVLVRLRAVGMGHRLLGAGERAGLAAAPDWPGEPASGQIGPSFVGGMNDPLPEPVVGDPGLVDGGMAGHDVNVGIRGTPAWMVP